MQDICLRCGSKKVIPNVSLHDSYGEFGGFSSESEVKVARWPKRLFFKGDSAGKVRISICGDCGHADMTVTNFEELYYNYENSRKS